MSGGSLAFRQYELLKEDRASQLAQMRERMTELGDDRGLRQLDAMMTEFGALGPQSPDDPVGEMLTALTRETKDILADLGASRTAMDDLWVMAIDLDAFSARMRRFTDGSGLVTVSDATFGLCGLYAEVLALTGQRGIEPQVLSGLLRFYNTQQRVFGLRGKLGIRLEPVALGNAHLLLYLASQFVLAHELAHYLLGHPSSVSAFAPEEYLPVCSESHQLEAEADLHALRVVRRAFEGGEAAFGAVGAVIGMLAVHVTEQALFVRRGASHPPARQRAAALIQEMTPEERAFAKEAFDLTLAATEAACETGAGSVPFTAGMFGSAPIHTPLSPSHLQTAEVFDALQCLSRESYLTTLDQASREFGEPWLADGARLAAEGDSAGALRTWGVPKGKIGALCDPKEPLTFNALHSKLQDAFTQCGIPKSHVPVYAIAAAMLVGEFLKGDGLGDQRNSH
ncbi:hypothetical protein [Streptomyces sp. NPDC058623]|uniref:hypothetical protein n=1 Tax=Streptomyces sp. NPDC058623 TaxID=3346563 RepID=UPI0036696990